MKTIKMYLLIVLLHVTDTLFTGKWQQNLKAWIQLQVAKPQAWAQLSRAGRVNRREMRLHGGFQQPALFQLPDLAVFTSPNPSWGRGGWRTHSDRWLGGPQSCPSLRVLPCRQQRWYSPCCLGELTLLSGIGHISRAHCFQAGGSGSSIWMPAIRIKRSWREDCYSQVKTLLPSSSPALDLTAGFWSVDEMRKQAGWCVQRISFRHAYMYVTDFDGDLLCVTLI